VRNCVIDDLGFAVAVRGCVLADERIELGSKTYGGGTGPALALTLGHTEYIAGSEYNVNNAKEQRGSLRGVLRT
jgi:hypothetical protein